MPRATKSPYEPLERLPLEPDLHFHYRWVASKTYHSKEPRILTPFRKILNESPDKFYTLYQQQQARFDKLVADDKEKSGSDEPLEPCEALVKQLLDEWEKER